MNAIIMKYSFLPLIVVTWTSGTASELSDHPPREVLNDRSLQDDGSSSIQQFLATLIDPGTGKGGDSTCATVCNNIGDGDLSSVTMDIEEEKNGIAGFFGNIIDSITSLFDGESFFGRLMNRLFNLLRPPQSDKASYEIPTDMIAPVLSNYSMKAKSLAKLIRSESDAYASASGTPDVMRSIFDLSATNIESISSLIDPIVDEMRQHETMNIATASCSIRQLLVHIRDDTLPNVVSIAEVIYTKSRNEEMETLFNEYRTATAKAATADSLSLSSAREDNSNQCFESDGSTGSSSEARIGAVGEYLAGGGALLLLVVGLVVLFPISFIVSIASFVVGIFIIFYAVIFQSLPPFLPVDNDVFGGAIESILVILGLIASPIIIPIFIIAAAIYLVVFLLRPLFQERSPPTLQPVQPPVFMPGFQPVVSPIFQPPPGLQPVLFPVFIPGLQPVPTPSSQPVSKTGISPMYQSVESPSASNLDEQTKDVLNRLSMVLEAPIESIVDTLQRLYGTEINEDDEPSLDCAIKTMSCHNNALLESLPS